MFKTNLEVSLQSEGIRSHTFFPVIENERLTGLFRSKYSDFAGKQGNTSSTASTWKRTKQKKRKRNSNKKQQQ